MNQDGHCIGELPGAKIISRWRFSEADLHTWLEQQKSARTLKRLKRPFGKRRKVHAR